MVYYTRRFVLCVTLCHFVLVFFSPFSMRLPRLGKRELILVLFRTFVRFMFVWICRFPLPLGVWERLRFVIVALPGLFLPFFCVLSVLISLFFSLSVTDRLWSAIVALPGHLLYYLCSGRYIRGDYCHEFLMNKKYRKKNYITTFASLNSCTNATDSLCSYISLYLVYH